MADITLAQLLEAGVHFGHKAYRWNPKMFPYIYTERNNIHILDLVQSAQLLKEANSYLESASEKGKTFLFVGTKRQASALVAQEAKRCNSYYVNHRWLGGMLTNWSTIQTRIEQLKEFEEKEINGELDSLSKKDYSSKRKEIDKLRRLFNGIKDSSTIKWVNNCEFLLTKLNPRTNQERRPVRIKILRTYGDKYDFEFSQVNNLQKITRGTVKRISK